VSVFDQESVASGLLGTGSGFVNPNVLPPPEGFDALAVQPGSGSLAFPSGTMPSGPIDHGKALNLILGDFFGPDPYGVLEDEANASDDPVQFKRHRAMEHFLASRFAEPIEAVQGDFDLYLREWFGPDRSEADAYRSMLSLTGHEEDPFVPRVPKEPEGPSFGARLPGILAGNVRKAGDVVRTVAGAVVGEDATQEIPALAVQTVAGAVKDIYKMGGGLSPEEVERRNEWDRQGKPVSYRGHKNFLRGAMGTVASALISQPQYALYALGFNQAAARLTELAGEANRQFGPLPVTARGVREKSGTWEYYVSQEFWTSTMPQTGTSMAVFLGELWAFAGIAQAFGVASPMLQYTMGAVASSTLESAWNAGQTMTDITGGGGVRLTDAQDEALCAVEALPEDMQGFILNAAGMSAAIGYRKALSATHDERLARDGADKVFWTTLPMNIAFDLLSAGAGVAGVRGWKAGFRASGVLSASAAGYFQAEQELKQDTIQNDALPAVVAGRAISLGLLPTDTVRALLPGGDPEARDTAVATLLLGGKSAIVGSAFDAANAKHLADLESHQKRYMGTLKQAADAGSVVARAQYEALSRPVPGNDKSTARSLGVYFNRLRDMAARRFVGITADVAAADTADDVGAIDPDGVTADEIAAMADEIETQMEEDRQWFDEHPAVEEDAAGVETAEPPVVDDAAVAPVSAEPDTAESAADTAAEPGPVEQVRSVLAVLESLNPAARKMRVISEAEIPAAYKARLQEGQHIRGYLDTATGEQVIVGDAIQGDVVRYVVGKWAHEQSHAGLSGLFGADTAGRDAFLDWVQRSIDPEALAGLIDKTGMTADETRADPQKAMRVSAEEYLARLAEKVATDGPQALNAKQSGIWGAVKGAIGKLLRTLAQKAGVPLTLTDADLEEIAVSMLRAAGVERTPQLAEPQTGAEPPPIPASAPAQHAAFTPSNQLQLARDAVRKLYLTPSDRRELKDAGINLSPRYVTGNSAHGMNWDQAGQLIAREYPGLGLSEDNTDIAEVARLFVGKAADFEVPDTSGQPGVVEARELAVGDAFTGPDGEEEIVVEKRADGSIVTADGIVRQHDGSAIVAAEEEVGRATADEMDDAEEMVARHEADAGGVTRFDIGDDRTFSEAEIAAVFKSAVKNMGLTKDIREAGYVLPDGRMLDFSGKRDGGDSGVRYMDHREIDYDGAEGYNEPMVKFLRMGALRIDANLGMVSAEAPLSSKQRQAAELVLADGGWVDGERKDMKRYYVEVVDGSKARRALGELQRFLKGEDVESHTLFSIDADAQGTFAGLLGDVGLKRLEQYAAGVLDMPKLPDWAKAKARNTIAKARSGAITDPQAAYDDLTRTLNAAAKMADRTPSRGVQQQGDLFGGTGPGQGTLFSIEDDARRLVGSMRYARGSTMARSAAAEFLNKPLHNRETGIVATVSGSSLGKMLSRSAVDQSISPQAHMQAVANLDRLFPVAIPRLTRSDRNNDPTVKALHHFSVPMPFDSDVLHVKIMAKEFRQSGQGTRLYLVQAVEIVKPASWLKVQPTSSETTPGYDPLAGFNGKIQQFTDAVKAAMETQAGDDIRFDIGDAEASAPPSVGARERVVALVLAERDLHARPLGVRAVGNRLEALGLPRTSAAAVMDEAKAIADGFRAERADVARDEDILDALLTKELRTAFTSGMDTAADTGAAQQRQIENAYRQIEMWKRKRVQALAASRPGLSDAELAAAGQSNLSQRMADVVDTWVPPGKKAHAPQAEEAQPEKNAKHDAADADEFDAATLDAAEHAEEDVALAPLPAELPSDPVDLAALKQTIAERAAAKLTAEGYKVRGNGNTDPVLRKEIAVTWARLLRGAAWEHVPHGAQREWIVDALRRLELQPPTVAGAGRRVSQLAYWLSRAAIKADADVIVKRIDKLLKLKRVKSKGSTRTELIKREIEPAAKAWLRLVKSVYKVGEVKSKELLDTLRALDEQWDLGQIDADTLRERLGLISGGLATDPVYLAMDPADAIDEAMRALAKYGAIRHRSPADIRQALDELQRDYDEGVAAIAEARQRRRDRMGPIRETIAAAVRTAPLVGRQDGLKAGLKKLARGNYDFYQGMRDLVRFAKGDLHEDAVDAIMNLSMQIQESHDAYHAYVGRTREAIAAAVKEIYGHWDVEKVLKDLEKPLATLQQFSRNPEGRVQLSHSNLLAIIAMLDQEHFARNAEKFDRAGTYLADLKAAVSEQDLKFLDWLRESYHDNRPEISAKSVDVNGVPVVSPDALYHPGKVAREAAGLAEFHYTLQLAPETFEQRRRHNWDLDETASVVGLYHLYADRNARFLSHVDLAQDMRYVFGHPDTRRAIESRIGKKGAAQLLEYITKVVRGRNFDKGTAGHEVHSRVRGISTLTVMSGNVGSGIRQLCAVGGVPMAAGAMNSAKAVAWQIAHPKRWRQIVNEMKKNPSFRQWATRGYLEAVDNAMHGTDPLTRFLQLGMVVQSAGIQGATFLVVPGLYEARKKDLIGQGLTPEHAAERAMTWANWLVHHTQGSAQTATTAIEMLSREEAGKWIMMYTGPLTQLYGWEQRAFREVAAGTPGAKRQIGNVLLANHVVIPSLYMLGMALQSTVVGKFRDRPDKEVERLLKRWAAMMVLGPVGGVFLLGPVIETFVDIGFGQSFGGGGMPVVEQLTRLGASGYSLMEHTLIDWDPVEMAKDWNRIMSQVSAPWRDTSRAIENWSD